MIFRADRKCGSRYKCKWVGARVCVVCGGGGYLQKRESYWRHEERVMLDLAASRFEETIRTTTVILHCKEQQGRHG